MAVRCSTAGGPSEGMCLYVALLLQVLVKVCGCTFLQVLVKVCGCKFLQVLVKVCGCTFLQVL